MCPMNEPITEPRCAACGFSRSERANCKLTSDGKHRLPEIVQAETAEQQINRLALFIMEEVPGEPSRSEGAVDVAIRLIRATL